MQKQKEWNGGAIVSLIYIIIYILVLIPAYRISSFVINSDKFIFQFLLGLIGMTYAFKNFRTRYYGKGSLFYFISLIPSLIWVLDGLDVAMILSIFVIITLVKHTNSNK